MTTTYAESRAVAPNNHVRQQRDGLRRAEAVVQPSKKALWGGYAASAFALLFLLFDLVMKLFQLAPAVQATSELGYAASVVLPLGLLQLACWVLYVIPRTAVLGAILWTGYLGGAVATHVRVGNPLFSHTLFPLYVGLLLWGGLWLRDLRLRALLPTRAR